MEPRSKTEARLHRLNKAQARLIEAQDTMLVVYRTQALHRGAAAAERLVTAREGVEQAKAALAKAVDQENPTDA